MTRCLINSPSFWPRIVAVAILSIASCGTVMAQAVFNGFESITLEPGEVLEQPILWKRDNGIRLEVRLVEAPSSARLVVGGDGNLILQWESGLDMQALTPMVVQARDIDSGLVVDTGLLEVHRAQLSDEPVDVGLAMPLADEPVVSLEPLTGQIVSAGRVVSMRIKASSSDEQTPILAIDRVPRNASFEKNRQGGYTLFWQTSNRDQGVHVFRVTASHPDGHVSVDSRELTIVVGDPSFARTRPE